MYTRITILGLVAAAAICGSGGVAQAGLIVPQHGEQQSLLLAADGERSGVAPRQHDRARLSWIGELAGLLAMPTTPIPIGGMGVQTAGAGCGTAVLTEFAHHPQPTLMAWGVLAEQMLSLPPPIGGRFFRPPRSRS